MALQQVYDRPAPRREPSQPLFGGGSGRETIDALDARFSSLFDGMVHNGVLAATEEEAASFVTVDFVQPIGE